MILGTARFFRVLGIRSRNGTRSGDAAAHAEYSSADPPPRPGPNPGPVPEPTPPHRSPTRFRCSPYTGKDRQESHADSRRSNRCSHPGGPAFRRFGLRRRGGFNGKFWIFGAHYNRGRRDLLHGALWQPSFRHPQNIMIAATTAACHFLVAGRQRKGAFRRRDARDRLARPRNRLHLATQ